MLAAGERTDPWLRLVLLSRKRPMVIDLAVLIDGKSFRDKRDSWIDELVSTPKPAERRPENKTTKKEKGNNKSEPVGTKPAVKPSESATAKADVPKKEDKKEDKPRRTEGRQEDERRQKEKEGRQKEKPPICRADNSANPDKFLLCVTAWPTTCQQIKPASIARSSAGLLPRGALDLESYCLIQVCHGSGPRCRHWRRISTEMATVLSRVKRLHKLIPFSSKQTWTRTTSST